MREKLTSNLIDGFVAQRPVEQPNLAVSKILLQEGRQFAGRTGIVRAVEIKVRSRLQFFETAGPGGVGQALHDGVVGDAKAALLEIARGAKGVERVLQLEAAGKAGRENKGLPGRVLSDARPRETVVAR